VAVGVGVDDGVEVAVGVRLGAGVGVSGAVGDGDGVEVVVGDGDGVGLDVGVAVGVGVGVPNRPAAGSCPHTRASEDGPVRDGGFSPSCKTVSKSSKAARNQ
jgi:hypothetical protein